MGTQDTFHSARIMGAWVVDMVDPEGAQAAIALCRSRTPAVLEVRQTLWGVQVKTDSQAAADLLAVGYVQPNRPALAA